MTPQDRVRRQLAEKFEHQVAERLYQVDKGSALAKLEDILTDSSRQVYYDAAMSVMLGPTQKARMQAVHLSDAHGHASKTDDTETVRRQAAQDLDRFGKTGRIQ